MNTIHTAETMAIGTRITLAAVATISAAAAALGFAVLQHPASAAAAPAVAVAAPARAPGPIAEGWCPHPPSNGGKPGQLAQVVSSAKCTPTDGSVSGPGGGGTDPTGDDGTGNSGDGGVCLSPEGICRQPV